MKQMRLYLYITFGAFLALFIVGTFVDFQLSSAIYSSRNTFGLVVSVLEGVFGYGIIALMGGGLLSLFFKKEAFPKWGRILFLIGSIFCLGITTYFSGNEYFGLNGFYWVAKTFYGYFISFPIMALLTYLGYLFFKKVDNPNLWIILVTFLICYAIAIVAGSLLIKIIFHRPRFRSVFSYEEIKFLPWYVRCTNYKDLMKTYGLASEEFKSFPSGHATRIISLPVVMVLLPLIDKKYTKYRLPLFICGLIIALLVMFSRILVGAHYLSDVSMGAIITILLFIAGLETIRATKKINL